MDLDIECVFNSYLKSRSWVFYDKFFADSKSVEYLVRWKGKIHRWISNFVSLL